MNKPSPRFSIVYHYVINDSVRTSYVAVGDLMTWTKPVAIKHAKDFANKHKLACKVISANDAGFNSDFVFEALPPLEDKTLGLSLGELVMLKALVQNEIHAINLQCLQALRENDDAGYLCHHALESALKAIADKIILAQHQK